MKNQPSLSRDFSHGRLHFDGIPYDGSIVNMGLMDSNGDICYILGMLKSIRKELGKKDGDTVRVIVKKRL